MSVTFCRLGRNVRLVLLLAWETLLPTCRPLPVSSHTRDMVYNPDLDGRVCARKAPPVSLSVTARQRCALEAVATTSINLRYRNRKPDGAQAAAAQADGRWTNARAAADFDRGGARHPDCVVDRFSRHQSDPRCQSADD